MPRVVWTAAAREDLIAIRKRLKQYSPNAAARVAERIRRRVIDLRDHPEIGRPGRVIGTRELVITDTDFLLIYVVDNDTTILLTVVNGKQDR